MSKVEIFVPYKTTEKKMREYFSQQDVIRLFGPPISPAVNENSDYDKILEIATNYAEFRFERDFNYHYGYYLDRNPFNSLFYVNNKIIGWKFEFIIYEELDL